MDRLIITVALIGGVTTRDKTPHPPMTPKEIAENAKVREIYLGAKGVAAKPEI